MKDNQDFAERLKILQGDRKVVEFARYLGVNNSTLWNYLEGRVPPADFLTLVIRKTGVNGHWLLVGEGEMYVPGKEPVALRETILKLRAAATAVFALVFAVSAFAGVTYRNEIADYVYGSAKLTVDLGVQPDAADSVEIKIVGQEKVLAAQKLPAGEKLVLDKLPSADSASIEAILIDSRGRKISFGRSEDISLKRGKIETVKLSLADIYPPEAVKLESLPTTANSETIDISGVREPGSAILVDGKMLAGADDSENFSGKLQLGQEGENSFRIEAVDLAGNVSPAITASVVRDTIAPAKPSVNILPPSVNKSEQLISGSREPGSSITINGRMVVPASDSKTWAVSQRLESGLNKLRISAVDEVGNASPSAEMKIYLDTTPPAPPTIEAE